MNQNKSRCHILNARPLVLIIYYKLQYNLINRLKYFRVPQKNGNILSQIGRFLSDHELKSQESYSYVYMINFLSMDWLSRGPRKASLKVVFAWFVWLS